jgi:DNA-binding NarL/FixJ family response regulator
MVATILIVEDHEMMRRSLVEWLRIDFSRFRVIGVASGEEALGLAEAERLALVITDVRLGGVDGIETASRLKALQPKTCIVILTMHDELAYRVRASAAGASAFVSKQRMHVDLLPILRALVSRRGYQGSPPRQRGKSPGAVPEQVAGQGGSSLAEPCGERR